MGGGGGSVRSQDSSVSAPNKGMVSYSLPVRKREVRAWARARMCVRLRSYSSSSSVEISLPSKSKRADVRLDSLVQVEDISNAPQPRLRRRRTASDADSPV